MSDDDDLVPDEAPDEEAIASDEAAVGGDEAAADADDDTSGEDDAANDDEGEDEGDKPAKPKASVQKRIDQLTRTARAAERDRDYWREQARLAAQGRQQPQEEPKQQQTGGDAPPKLEDFNSDAEYFRALARYEVQQEQAKARQSEETARQQQESDTLRARFDEGRTSALEKYPDYDEVVHDPSLRVPGDIARLVFQTENPNDVAYHLAKNPKVLADVGSLPLPTAAMKLGQISARLGAPASAPKSATKAPKPPPTVKPRGSSPGKDPNKMSQDEYNAWRDSGGGE